MEGGRHGRSVELATLFDHILVPQGFSRSGLERFKRNGWAVWAWTKEVDRSLVHQVELLVKRPGLDNALVNQAVYLGEGGPDEHIDGRTIQSLYYMNRRRIFLPSGNGPSLLWWFKKKRIAKGLNESLAWFGPFSSISRCIEWIESGQSSVGSGPGVERILQILRGARKDSIGP